MNKLLKKRIFYSVSERMIVVHIKIKKSSSDSYWYADKIDQQFEVSGVEEDIYRVKNYSMSEVGIRWDIAPVLKVDAEEIVSKSYPETRKAKPWQVKEFRVEKAKKLAERSSFNTKQEINKYEKLNSDAEVINKFLDEI